MTREPDEQTELLPLTIIRTETALSRYPVHRLSKKGTVEIELRNADASFRWEVSYNSKHGQPGPLAYKVDTLVINRRIEEVGRPLPAIIRLGSLRDIADQAGIGQAHTSKLKKALLQNASAFINAKMRYKRIDGAEVTTEFAGSRYGLVFTGETLPDGRKADAVYLVVNEWYRQVLDSAQTRPLDYDYLKDLSPGAQRLYELLSFQMYGALTHMRPRAKLVYSEFCTYAPQTRYLTFDQVKKQMHKLHSPHRKSGYIARVQFEETADEKGQLDWNMLYTPGPKAKGEFTLATGPRRRVSGRRAVQETLPLGAEAVEEGREGDSPDTLTAEQAGFLETLVGYGVSETEARRLVVEKVEACRLKVDAIPYLPETQGKENRGGNIRTFIERDDWVLPDAFKKAQAKAEKDKRAHAKRAAIEVCALCDKSGHRFVVMPDHPRGVMVKCTHDPEREKLFPAA